MEPTFAQSAVEPRVVFWYRVYCGFMAFLYVLCIGGGIALLAFRTEIAAEDPETPEEILVVYGFFLLVLGLVLTGAYIAAFFLPRERWAWIFHLVLICLGLTSCCSMLASIPLLIYWIKPEVQTWFGMKKKPPQTVLPTP